MISVAMIVKNEVKTLESTINYVKDYVDEIIIGVDKASNDGTLDVAKKLADKVIPIYLSEELKRKGPKPSKSNTKEWGFSKARNKVLGHCKKENWRLTLDGHEKILNPETMKDAVEEAIAGGYDSVCVKIRFEPDMHGIPKLLYWQGRLFASNVRYNNPLHNVPVVNKSFNFSGFQVEHKKQDQDVNSKRERDVQRASSTINGFLKQIKENPKNSRPWFYLGNAYKENNRWKEAIEAYKEYLLLSVWKEERWHARTNMGICYKCLNNLIDAREQFVLALDEFPTMVEAYYYLADLAYKQERFKEAQVWLEASINMPIPEKYSLFVNPQIYIFLRYDKLSMVYNHLGRYEDAIKQAKKAYEGNPDPRILNNIECWERTLNK